MKARQNNLIFRPHFKTHNHVDIGRMYREHGVNAITVSSIQMAEKFASAGWTDITIAFLLNIHELDRINDLARKIKLNILVENTNVFPYISKALYHQTGFFIKIDTGYNRTGVDCNNHCLLNKILSEAEHIPVLEFRGFLTHSGNTYQANSKDEIRNIHEESCLALKVLKDKYIRQYPQIISSAGDTPSCSICDNFPFIDEIRPGNYIYYDAMQYYLGSCKLDDIAVCMACPVVAIHKNRNEIVVHGGAIHLSKESIKVKGRTVYGLIAKLMHDSWQILDDNNYVISLSQEHGIIYLEENFFNEFCIGDFIGIIPAHSCLAANMPNDTLLID